MGAASLFNTVGLRSPQEIVISVDICVVYHPEHKKTSIDV